MKNPLYFNLNRLVLPDALRALGGRNYRIFFFAQAVSMSGLWMYRVALGWLVFDLTQSNSALGLMDFCACIPVVLLTAVAGAMIERWDLRKVLIACQAGCMVIAAILAFLSATNLATMQILVVIALLRGTIDSFEMPSRYSMVSFLVDKKEDLPNAVALNSTIFNTARMIGPPLAGFIINAVGEAICFILNGAAYSSMILAMKKVRLDKPPICRDCVEKATPIRDMVEGLKATRDFAPAKYLLIMVTLTGFFAFPSIVLMPAMARSILGGTSRTLGLLLMGVAVGALVASLIMASRKSPKGLAKVCSYMCVAFGLAQLVFSLSPNIPVAIVLAAPIGFTMVSCTISCNSLLQMMSPPEKRSRVMSLYTLAIMGIPTFGSLTSGKLADWFGTNWSLFICGAICAVLAYYYKRKLDRLEDEINRALIKQGALAEE